jgi:hypothetical protein
MRSIDLRHVVVGGLLFGACAGPLAGQLPNASAAALGSGQNHTAAARGWSAIALNPAGLAMPDGPAASASIMAVRGVGGLGPIRLGDVAGFEGGAVPEEVRRQWLDRIISAGGENGSAGAEVSYLAAQVGRFGLQVGTVAHLVGNLGAGAAELLLFGNAGRTGEPAALALGETRFDVVMTSTGGVSYAQPVIRGGGRALSIGATLKYTVGHLMLTGVDLGSESTAEPIGVQVMLPMVQTDTSLRIGGRERGAGIGLDLGVAWSDGPFQAGLTMTNVFNTFAWNEANLVYRSGEVSVEGQATATDWEPQPYSDAPLPVRARVQDLGYAPVIAAGIAVAAAPGLRLSADLRQRLGDGQPVEAATHAGGGLEYRPLGWLPLRAGGAIVSGGYLLSAGAGLQVGAVRLDAAAARQRDDFGTASVGTVTFSLELR